MEDMQVIESVSGIVVAGKKHFEDFKDGEEEKRMGKWLLYKLNIIYRLPF